MKQYTLILAISLLLTGCGNASPEPKEPTHEEKPCTREYKPICGTTPDGIRQTFGNMCMAQNAQATRMLVGRCKDIHPDFIRPEEQRARAKN